MYKVVVKFKDLKDDHIYEVGDKYPFDKRRVSQKRLQELSSENNKRGMPLIVKEEGNK